MTQTTISLEDLIPTLRKDVESSVHGLPTFLDWSDSPGFRVSGLTAHFTLDGVTYIAELDVDVAGGGAVHNFSINHTRVPVIWTISIDIQTGEVWAKPTFTQYKVNKGSPDGDLVDLQVFCRHLGLSRPQMVKILGRMVRVGNPDILPTQKVVLNNIGMDPSYLGLWYPQRSYDSVRHVLRRAFDL